ncbi:hypothetical protein AMATHDRAFT_68973 [Amanita thiersii Skay4041]|uniref:J domain-containing protein n=1 Tax=Amanita thiersii Skay4041 TaxID=703135 RepID=A0A2A9N8Q8_9AGAR|nr:hypothetical protein AMATHDRAFT_68973 [Amanita thiersii Skay4041]
MAKYNYDEAGNMAGYFLITFLALILVPMTITALKPGQQTAHDGCLCKLCADRRRWLAAQQKRSIFNPRVSRKTAFLIFGWSLLVYVSYRVMGIKSDSKVYDPFEILGIKAGMAEKEIKAHYKKLSRTLHPDKVKATANMTMEMIQEKFVEITKAYKSLTDETIRKNWELYGNPDGRQEMSMGIALPRWIIESKNNVWVLGVYGLVFGGALPAMVGRWWFGSRQRTKDGVHAKSAAEYFKSLREESTIDEVVDTLGKSYTWEHPHGSVTKSVGSDAEELKRLEKEIGLKAENSWKVIGKAIKGGDEARRRGVILMYAHMLRIEVNSSNLIREQIRVVQQTPLLLNALLNITLSRNWLLPALSVMRLHAYLAQALPPSSYSLARAPSTKDQFTPSEFINPLAPQFAQLPGVSSSEEADDLAPHASDFNDFVHILEEKKDSRLLDVKTALKRWGHVDLVDASFKVIGERVITPSAIIYLVVKLRLTPPLSQSTNGTRNELDVDETKRLIKINDEKDEEFLKSRKDAEDLLDQDDATRPSVHAPYWPGDRKPSWWIVLADDKSNRVVVPPIKITDIPYARLPGADADDALLERDFRAFKIQFQGPPNTGMFTWRVYVVSDTFVGEEVMKEISLKIEDAPVVNSDDAEDEISDPDEDTFAGQMAAMRGGPTKKRQNASDDDDSSDEADSSSSSSSSSDSDSD